jgi:autotransporter-associated beta strand protein
MQTHASLLAFAAWRRFVITHLFVLLALTASLPASGALIGYWNFDESSGTTASDTSGRVGPLNGTLSASGAGATVPAWIAGRFGNALDFNQNGLGAGGLVTVPYNGDLRLSNAFTISFWWRPDYAAAASTFPGIVRIGSQSPVPPAANAGWGFFRPQGDRARYKRGNHQPDVWNPAMTVGQWHHVAVTHDGAGNNVAFVNGTTTTFVTNWPALTTTAVLEFGRMDSFDNAGLDDFALFNEQISLAKVRSLYTLPNSLGLSYDLATMRQLWNVFDGGPGSSGVVGGATWSYTNSLPGSTTLGDSYLNGVRWYVVLSNGVGVVAVATLLGDLSPNGVGVLGTTTFNETPAFGTTARFVFDLNTTTGIGGGTNDLYIINGDLNLAGQSVVVNPVGPLATGTYRLLNYTGTKTGSFNPIVLGNTRYNLTIDDSTTGEINLVVSGNIGAVRWVSPANANWNFSVSNWLNVSSGLPDTFFNGDTATFNDALVYATNISIAAPVYPSALAVNSSTLNYSFNGQPIRGMANGLTKSGPSLLTLGAANGFYGPVYLNQGSIRMGNAASLGLTNGGTIIASGATLDLGGFSPGTESITVSGAGIGSTGAVVNAGAALVNTGLNGPVTLTGDTTLGGNNRFDISGGTFLGGGFSLTKTGTAEIAMSNLRDTGLGNIEVQWGQLTILGSTLMGDPNRTVTVRSNATLAHWASGTNRHNKPLIMQWARLLNGTSPADNATNIATVSLTGTNTFDGASSITLLNEVSGSGALTKNAAGTLSLGGTNTYAGPTTVNAGSLSLIGNGSIATTPLITIASGAKINTALRTDGTLTLNSGQTLAGAGTVDGTLALGPSTTVSPGFSAGTLTVTNGLNLNGGATLVYELGAVTNAGGLNDLINVGGALNLSGNNTIKVVPSGALDITGPYTLMNYVGTLTGDSNNLTAVSDTRMNFNVDTSVPGKVFLNVTSGAPAALTFLGSAPGNPTLWDLNNTPNWSGPSIPDRFFAGDRVLFDDTALQYNVTLVGDLYPGTVDVAAGLSHYTFSGSGRIRGGKLTKASNGILILANTGLNDYPGPTVITGGAIQVGNGGNFGNLGPNVVTNDSRLIINRSDDLTFANMLYGVGALEKQGPNILSLNAQMANFSGSIVANAGMIKPTVATGLGNTNGGTFVANGGTIDINGLALTNDFLTVEGAGVSGNGAIINSGAAQQTAFRLMALSGDATFGGTNRWDLRGAPAVLNGNNRTLTKVGPNEVWLVEAGASGLGPIVVNQGTLGIQGSTTMGDPLATATFNPGTTLGLFATTTLLDKNLVMNNAALVANSGFNSFNGPVALSGSNTFNMSAILNLSNVVSGNGSFNKLGTGTNFFYNENTYSGGTVVSAGSLFLGNNSPQGSVAGNILMLGGNLFLAKTNTYTLANNISGTGAGTVFVRTYQPDFALVLDGTAQISLPSGGLDVGRDVYGKVIIRNGATPFVTRLSLGNISGSVGEVVQEGGDVWIVTEARVGHWPNETSTYIMGGGTLNITNIPVGVVNQAGVAEQNGILYLGVDGTGVFTQTGGVVRAHGVVLDSRADTAGTDTLNLNGGVMSLGASGLKVGSLNANTSYAVNLGGGTLSFTASSTSVLAMTLTADSTIETAGGTNVITGAMTGGGGLFKTGSGVLVLTGTNSYTGQTVVNDGTLVVNGTVGGLVNQVTVNSGTIAGTGVINDYLDIQPGGTLAPGVTIGTLTGNSQIIVTGGKVVMELSKSGLVLTNDRVVAVDAIGFDGTLVVTATGSALAPGDSFDLFDAPLFVGAFVTLDLPALSSGLTWDTSDLYNTGVIRVSGGTPPSLSIFLSGGNLTLSWPPGFNSFVLQAQTNAPGTGINTNGWVTFPTGTNFVTFPVDTNPSVGSVFYRLISP